MNIDLILRISVFVAIFAVVAVWELIAPRGKGQTPKAQRWMNNLALVGFLFLIFRDGHFKYGW